MKNKIACILTATGLLAWSSGPALAERVIFRELPDPVRKVLQKNKDDIKKIESFTRDGGMVYEVQIDQEGPDKFIYVAQDGSRLDDAQLRAERKAALGTLKLADLPKPVQQTYRQQTGSAKVATIGAHSLNGRTVYEFEFTRAGGERDELWINEDGSLATTDRQLSDGGRNARIRNETIANNSPAVVARFDRPLAATQKVDSSNLPEAVRRSARNLAGSNRIEDAERGTLDGRTVYEIAFKQDGKHSEVRIAEDGTILQRVSGSDITYPGSLSINEVPAPVQRTIREQVGSGEVNDIDKMTLGGRTVYEVGFKRESGGAQHEIRIAEDGTFLGEPAGAGKK